MSKDIWAVSPEEIMFKVFESMSDKDVEALLGTENWQLVGIFSEYDYARKNILLSKPSLDTPVRDVMTKNIFYIYSLKSMLGAMAIITGKRRRSLPVVGSRKFK